MCGILGVTGAGVPAASFDRALGLLAHRGPDGEGVYRDDSITLGHRRLAIIDVRCGQQPMIAGNGRYVLTYNGELYNFRVLRKKLEAEGFRFQTQSDTEVLLHWLATRGTDGLAELNGMFAFAFWDKEQKKLLLARDRLGIKPLYYRLHDGHLIFASEIKPLLALSAGEADPQGIFEFLTFQNMLSARTLFKDVQKLMPGEWMRWSPEGSRSGSFWALSFPEPFGGGYEEAKALYSEALRDSVSRHLVGDVEVGAYLSGGFDSSSVATLAAEETNRPLHTFTGAFTDASYYDERPGARDVARRINAKFHEVEITARDYADQIEKVMYHLEEPTLGTGAFPQYMVARLVSQSVKVVLTGHGGDEMFAGYQVNKAAYLRETLARSPLRALSVLMGIRRDEWSRVLYYLLYPLVEPEVGSGLYIMVPQRQRSAFFSQDFLRLNRDFEPLEALRAAMGSEPLTPSKKILALYLRTYLPTLFIQEDKMSMAHSVESRTPLCDNELLELALRFPLRIKLWKNRLKALTRDVMSEKLPAVLYRLPKRGFPTPFARWYRREPLRSLMADLLFGRRTRERGMLNTAFMQRLFERNLRSRTDLLHDYARANQLYSASMVELWFRTFMDGRKGAPLELAGSVAVQPAPLLTDA